MKGIAQVDPAGFVADFTRSRLWTARVVRQFADADLDITPGPGSMPTRDQIRQVCQSDNFLASVMTDAVPTTAKFQRDYDVSTVAACMKSLRTSLDEVRESITTNTVAWDEEVEPFGPDWRLSRGQLGYLMIDHEAHHRGQLTVYLRVAGKTPVTLYEPVNEQIFDLNG